MVIVQKRTHDLDMNHNSQRISPDSLFSLLCMRSNYSQCKAPQSNNCDLYQKPIGHLRYCKTIVPLPFELL